MTKILQVSIYPEKGKKHSNAGGVASYTKNLITNAAYKTQAEEVTILCNKIKEQKESYTEEGIKVIRCFDRDARFIQQVYTNISRLNPDVVHIQQELGLYGNLLTAYLLQWLLFLLRKKNTIITLHGVVSLKTINKKFIRENNARLPVWLVKFGFWIIFKPLCRWARKIIVHEPVFKDILVQEYGIDEAKISVIYHGIEDLQVIERNKACEILGLDPSKHLVLFMGYLTGYKGLDLLIEGFSQFAKTDPTAYLIIGAGKHPRFLQSDTYMREYRRLEEKAKALISESQYQWCGFIQEKDIQNYFSACDVSLYPYTVSMSSSGPMALAIGYEKPFLASDVFATVVPDQQGIFQRTPEDLAMKLHDFFENKVASQDLVKTMKTERSWSRVIKGTIEIYSR